MHNWSFAVRRMLDGQSLELTSHMFMRNSTLTTNDKSSQDQVEEAISATQSIFNVNLVSPNIFTSLKLSFCIANSFFWSLLRAAKHQISFRCSSSSRATVDTRHNMMHIAQYITEYENEFPHFWSSLSGDARGTFFYSPKNAFFNESSRRLLWDFWSTL